MTESELPGRKPSLPRFPSFRWRQSGKRSELLLLLLLVVIGIPACVLALTEVRDRFRRTPFPSVQIAYPRRELSGYWPNVIEIPGRISEAIGPCFPIEVEVNATNSDYRGELSAFLRYGADDRPETEVIDSQITDSPCDGTVSKIEVSDSGGLKRFYINLGLQQLKRMSQFDSLPEFSVSSDIGMGKLEVVVQALGPERRELASKKIQVTKQRWIHKPRVTSREFASDYPIKIIVDILYFGGDERPVFTTFAQPYAIIVEKEKNNGSDMSLAIHEQGGPRQFAAARERGRFQSVVDARIWNLTSGLYLFETWVVKKQPYLSDSRRYDDEDDARLMGDGSAFTIIRIFGGASSNGR